MVRTLLIVSILLSSGLPIRVSQAQLLRGNAATPAAREPARVGLLGGLREAREERFRREEQAAIAAARSAAAQRNAAANPRANATAAQQAAGLANNNLLRRDAAPNATLPLTPYQRSLEAARVDANSRTSNYRGPNPGPAARGQENLGLPNSNINVGNTLSRPTPVTPASAKAYVPAPTGYDGPGVAIRLPNDARSIVNYLVDDIDTNSIRPGEQQVLDTKGSYVVRYSRGVTPDGRSFGESRYTITEGRYRFELTSTGWELYREPDTDANLAPPNRVDLAETPSYGRSNDVLLPEPSSQSELRRILPNQSNGKSANEPPASDKSASDSVTSDSVTSEPVTSEPAVNEEVLPAPKPRSILE